MASNLLATRRRDVVAVLDVDQELAEPLAATRRARALPLSAARLLRRDVGTWDSRQDAAHGRDGFGLLVIDGLLVRRVGIGGLYAGELLSDGDLLQPAHHDGEAATLPFEATWRVLSPLRLAVLDRAWMARMAPFPEVFGVLMGRAIGRSRQLASLQAIAQHHRLDDRLWLFFWELADRYGRVEPDGVRLDVRLTHELIGHLVSARRPSISAAIGRLEKAGRLRRTGGSWLLLGPAPDPVALLSRADGTEPGDEPTVRRAFPEDAPEPHVRSPR